MSIENKNAIVSGGSRGIGRAITEKLVQNGVNVTFTYKENEKAADETLQACKDYKGNIYACKVDVTDYDEVLSFANKIGRGSKSIDILINNAGVRSDKSLLFMSKEEWEKVLMTNLTGGFYLIKAVLPYMLKQRSGRIVNISSVSGIVGLAGQVNYSASKAGLIGLTKALSKEVSSFGVCINAIAPGPVETDMLKGMPEKAYEGLLERIPAKRTCTAEEVAMLAHVLIDNELTPDYLTGQVISLDGGGF